MADIKSIWSGGEIEGSLFALKLDGTISSVNCSGKPERIMIPVNTIYVAHVKDDVSGIIIHLMEPKDYLRILRVLRSHETKRSDIGGSLPLRAQDWLWEKLNP